MAESVARTSSNAPQRAPAKESQRGAEAGPQLSVRYWKRMRKNKVYPVVVAVAGRGAVDPVTVRLVVAGAQVVPAEQVVDPANPGETATFYVTPVARGRLRGERIEVLQHGRKIQEIRIPCKIVSQRSTVLCLIAALLIPWLLLHFLVYAPIGFQSPLHPSGTQVYFQNPWKQYANEIESKEKPESRSASLKHFFEDNMPKLDSSMYKDVQDIPHKAYLTIGDNYDELEQPLAFYLFCFLMILTVVSFLTNRESRKTAYGKPLPVGAE